MIPVKPDQPVGPFDVAALYVDTARGPYRHIPGVDLWGFANRNGQQLGMFVTPNRDARTYDGPAPVVAHPPCGPWGRFWWNYKGGEGAAVCALFAVAQVQRFGGILEHPSGSRLWAAACLPKPNEPADRFGGFTIEIDQVAFGHPCRKRTWLYCCHIDRDCLPGLPAANVKPSRVMVRLLRNADELPELGKGWRHLTPWRFAVWLCEAASKAKPPAVTK